MAKLTEWAKRLTELDALGWDDRTIAAALVSEGFKTKQGLPIDHRAVAQQRYTLKSKARREAQESHRVIDDIFRECRMNGTIEAWRVALAAHACSDPVRSTI